MRAAAGPRGARRPGREGAAWATGQFLGLVIAFLGVVPIAGYAWCAFPRNGEGKTPRLHLVTPYSELTSGSLGFFLSCFIYIFLISPPPFFSFLYFNNEGG